MRRAVFMLAITLALILIRAPHADHALASDPGNTVRVTNIIVNDNRKSFTVTWFTNTAETGQVQLVGGNKFNDERGASYSGQSHSVVVTGLTPGTTYQFDIISGGTTYDNGGQHWAATLGGVLQPTAPNRIVAKVEGAGLADTLVSVTIQDKDGQGTPGSSTPLSVVVDPSGFFTVNLNDARTSDLTNYFAFSDDDQVTILVTGPGGSATETTTVGNPALHSSNPAQALTITLGGAPRPTPTGVVQPTATTARGTATPIPPTLTSTVPVPTLPSATAAATAQVATDTPPAPPPTAAGGQTVVPPRITETPHIEPTFGVKTPRAAVPTSTRIIRLPTATPEAPSGIAGVSYDIVIAIIALAAFVAAGILAIAAFFVWKR